MKSTLFITFIFFCLTFIMSACGGGSGRPSDTVIPSSTSTTTIEVERGPVKLANVKDANGNLARDKNGSNFYVFDSLPTYPITVTEGIIEINNDKNKTVILDINMSSYTNVITPITTLLSDSDKNKRADLEAYLMNTYNLTKEELYQSPSKSKNENIALLTNVIYKITKEKNSSINTIFSYKNLITDTDTTLNDEFKRLSSKLDTNDSLKTNGKLDSLKLENYLYDTNSSLFTKIDDLAILPTREVNTSDDVQDIWKISFKINPLTNYNDFNIGIKISKHENDGTPDIGEFVYSGLSIKSGKLSNPSRIDVYGVGDSGSGGTFFDSQYNTGAILENAITLNANTISLNLGYVMKQQSLVDASNFKIVTKYDIIVVSSLPIFKYSIDTSLSLIKNKYSFIGKKGMSGELNIK